ncbi:glycosyltransferase [Aporhodopirellula aestuarii]|uniref:Glycosyltransferase n=1 Tax=Aporhodopirellula aestuarii TaxID=2950107 RepID=A0ABT0UGM5_9BACT|nr:glycosyltransferase [Aporhodopirellula aestuarii]MCM2375146.1 glycosyltransferase [Aporhodopirellula aestuarii]
MKALMCHLYYKYPGGEDVVYEDECWLLQEYGHEVVRYEAQNSQIDTMGKIDLARKSFWNPETYRDIRELIQRESPDVVHCANTFPLFSPSLYQAAKDEGVPTVQTLHNFRLACVGGTLLRNGEVCHKCLGKAMPLSGIIHRCYQGSLTASTVSALMHSYHRRRGTWSRLIDQYILLTPHSKEIFTAAGLPPERMTVKPNFVRPDPGFHDSRSKKNYAVFVGRLSKEKGLDVLMDAWSELSEFPDLELLIVGEGPLRGLVESAAQRDPRIRLAGQLPRDQTMQCIGAAKFLVFPSVWYETFGRTIIEAQACGTPVIASNMGAMATLIQHDQTGLLFEPGNAMQLAERCRNLLADEQLQKRLSVEGRAHYEREFSAETNLLQLLNVYNKAGVNLADPSESNVGVSSEKLPS